MWGILTVAERRSLRMTVKKRKLHGKFNRPYKCLLCVKGGVIFVKKMTEGLFFYKVMIAVLCRGFHARRAAAL